MHKIMDNYGGNTSQLDWKYIVTYNLLSAKLGSDTKRGKLHKRGEADWGHLGAEA